MNGLFGLWCKLCELANITGLICTKLDTIVMNNATLCEKIDGIVGDPDAPCPECPETLGAAAEVKIEAAEASTAAAVATTAQVQATATAIKGKLSRSAKTAEKTEATKVEAPTAAGRTTL